MGVPFQCPAAVVVSEFWSQTAGSRLFPPVAVPYVFCAYGRERGRPRIEKRYCVVRGRSYLLELPKAAYSFVEFTFVDPVEGHFFANAWIGNFPRIGNYDRRQHALNRIQQLVKFKDGSHKYVIHFNALRVPYPSRDFNLFVVAMGSIEYHFSVLFRNTSHYM